MMIPMMIGFSGASSTAAVLVAAVFVIIANLIVDILYVAIDPRVRIT